MSKTDVLLEKIIADQEFIKRRFIEFINSYSVNLDGSRIMTNTRSGHRMFIDGRDGGSGFNIISDGHIEPHIMRCMQRLIKPGGVFLDVGANFGYYTIFGAEQIGHDGKVYSFEANPFLIDFISKSLYVNGLSRRVKIFNNAVSDKAGSARFGFSFDGIGGGSLAKGSDSGAAVQNIDVELVKIDDALPQGTIVDCVKIDVEGHEGPALLGMKEIIQRSQEIRIVLEFFPNIQGSSSNATSLLDIIEELGLNYWRIDDSGQLETVAKSELATGGDCYLVLARSKPDVTALSCPRRSLRLVGKQTGKPGELTGSVGDLLFHGPYWYLARGVYDIEIDGTVEGDLELSATHEFGLPLERTIISSSSGKLRVAIAADARYFEVVGRAASDNVRVNLEAVRIRDVQ